MNLQRWLYGKEEVWLAITQVTFALASFIGQILMDKCGLHGMITGPIKIELYDVRKMHKHTLQWLSVDYSRLNFEFATSFKTAFCATRSSPSCNLYSCLILFSQHNVNTSRSECCLREEKGFACSTIHYLDAFVYHLEIAIHHHQSVTKLDQ